jgi:hypothetical protein
MRIGSRLRAWLSFDLYRHAAHDTIIRDNGAILFRIRKTGAVIFEKAGADGRKVDL